jgi:hypothetical protein
VECAALAEQRLRVHPAGLFATAKNTINTSRRLPQTPGTPADVACPRTPYGHEAGPAPKPKHHRPHP